MKKMFILSSIALLYASLGWAQEPSAQPSAPSPTSTTNTSNETSGTVQGCLNGSDGNYILTQDSTGTVFKLIGSADKLKKHVGHEVAITGQLVGDSGSAASARDQQTAPTSGSADTSAPGSSTVQVSDVKMISQQCGSGSNAPQSR